MIKCDVLLIKDIKSAWVTHYAMTIIWILKNIRQDCVLGKQSLMFIKHNIMPVITYGFETWTLLQIDMPYLSTFEREILRWAGHIKQMNEN